jgi:hypothetical protein
MKREQLYTMTGERKAARAALSQTVCEEIDQFVENIFCRECEMRGYLLSDEEVIDITVVAMYDLLRHTKDYDGQ